MFVELDVERIAFAYAVDDCLRHVLGLRLALRNVAPFMINVAPAERLARHDQEFGETLGHADQREALVQRFECAGKARLDVGLLLPPLVQIAGDPQHLRIGKFHHVGGVDEFLQRHLRRLLVQRVAGTGLQIVVIAQHTAHRFAQQDAVHQRLVDERIERLRKGMVTHDYVRQRLLLEQGGRIAAQSRRVDMDDAIDPVIFRDHIFNGRAADFRHMHEDECVILGCRRLDRFRGDLLERDQMLFDPFEIFLDALIQRQRLPVTQHFHLSGDVGRWRRLFPRIPLPFTPRGRPQFLHEASQCFFPHGFDTPALLQDLHGAMRVPDPLGLVCPTISSECGNNMVNMFKNTQACADEAQKVYLGS